MGNCGRIGSAGFEGKVYVNLRVVKGGDNSEKEKKMGKRPRSHSKDVEDLIVRCTLLYYYM